MECNEQRTPLYDLSQATDTVLLGDPDSYRNGKDQSFSRSTRLNMRRHNATLLLKLDRMGVDTFNAGFGAP